MLHENISRQIFEILQLGLKDRTLNRRGGGGDGVGPDLSLAVISRQQKLALEVLHGRTPCLRLIKDQKQRCKL